VIPRRYVLGAVAGVLRGATVPQPGIALNEDNSHFFFTRAGRPLTEELVDALVDQYAGTQVRELLFSPNSMRTSFASRVWDPIWRGYDPEGADDQALLRSTAPAARASARRWIHTAWQLNRDGIDVYTRWLKRARRHGIAGWLSMRMNDLHNVDDEQSFMHSEFWRANPGFRRVTHRFSGTTDRALDYGRPEVREYHLKLVRELAERYDFDGLELDWMRFGYHFQPGRESAGRVLLTNFTREVRGILNHWEQRRGHAIRLGARVPSRPTTALNLGYDPVVWCREGLLDMLVVTPFWASIETDLPIETWRRALDGTRTVLAAGLELLIRPYHEFTPLQTNSLETVRGAAAAMLERGADRIYLFNYMDSETAIERLEDYPALLRQVGSLETLAGRARRHVVTYADTWAPGETRVSTLPADLRPGQWCGFRLGTGPAPESGGAEVRLVFDTPFDGEVRVNGVPCSAAGQRELPKPGPGRPARIFIAPGSALGAGDNVVELAPKTGNRLTWLEIAIPGRA